LFSDGKEDRKTMKTFLAIAFLAALLFLTGSPTSAQARLRLLPMKGSKVKLVYKTKSAVVDLDDALAGTNGAMPGEPPHRYTILFTAEKAGQLYLVVKVCSGSPVSSPTAPCGGDRPCAILWIRADKLLKEKTFQSEIYESCSYNFYDSKVKLTKTGIKINYGSGKVTKELNYDNAAPDKGLVIKEAATTR
jgi:hypothetical protein